VEGGAILSATGEFGFGGGGGGGGGILILFNFATVNRREASQPTAINGRYHNRKL
jgi:hypothetical protein